MTDLPAPPPPPSVGHVSPTTPVVKKSWPRRHPIWTAILVWFALGAVASVGRDMSRATSNAPPAFTASDGTQLNDAEIAGLDHAWNGWNVGQQRLICDELRGGESEWFKNEAIQQMNKQYPGAFTEAELRAGFEYIDTEKCSPS
jgi:hypothetical protein